MKFFTTLFFIIISVSISYTQNFDIEPLQSNSALFNAKTPIQTRVVDTIQLPFVEDFSYPGPYPDPDLWLDRKVYVNETMAFESPSVGVATFDAIDDKGRPYGQGLEKGAADTLTSNYINLKDYIGTDNIKRTLSAADNVVMSFFLQPKGNCYIPRIADSIVLEFRDAAGTWNLMRSFKGKPDSIINRNPFDTVFTFDYYTLPITESKYFFGKFQFRFRNFGRLGGAYEQWHLDYVKIAPNRTVTNKALDDLTFVESPKNILKRYTSMPWKHAQPQLANELQTAFNVKFYNHFTTTKAATNTNLRVSTSNGVVPIATLTLVDGFNIKAAEVVPSASKPFPTSLAQQLGTIAANTEKLIVTTEYNLIIEGQEGKDLKKDALRNDIINSKTIFDNYFAYDDGTAEMQFTATGTDVETAIRFKANVADSLRGVMIYFPFINGNAPATAQFNIRVWKDSLSTKTILFERKGINPYYLTQSVDTLQGFTTFKLADKDGKAIPIPAGDFYIGWQHVGTVNLPIGLDRNNRDKSQYVYTLINNTWQPLKDPKGVGYGAVMIRPVFGTRRVVESSPVQETPLADVMTLFPNPASEYLTVELKKGTYENYEFSIFNLSGQLQKREILRGGTIDINTLNNGIYFLRIRDISSNKLYNHKFIVQK
jgi:Secretion system C-terminal sorting domain